MSNLDMTEVTAWAAQLAAEAGTVESDSKPALRRVAEDVARGQRDRIRKRSGKSAESIGVDEDGDDLLIGADTIQAARIERGDGGHGPYPWAFNDEERAAEQLGREVTRTIRLGGP